MAVRSWYELLKMAMEEDNEDFARRRCTLDEYELREEFDAGYGSPEGKPFTAWGENFVYFPVCHDGAEWIGKVPRNPCQVATEHQGGW